MRRIKRGGKRGRGERRHAAFAPSSSQGLKRGGRATRATSTTETSARRVKGAKGGEEQTDVMGNNNISFVKLKSERNPNPS